ncbi:MAG TPA: SpoIIE family protein phosphatase [Intrasporangium sp.]|uniref:SpoIIE family protein phosphatase n=1 Tax=Intrasporangium sp. TaxID=1925024 RepID=UPI002D791A4D|nr:SpoIIE family protein phosphatase [Intrasporangium sp.]HET7398042.1 SpoIIE family protein phosphatase [Intrasporangium sp.]
MTDRERARLSAVPDPPEQPDGRVLSEHDVRRLFVPATTPTLPDLQVRAGCASSAVRGPGFAWFEVVAAPDRVSLVVGDTVAEGLVGASAAAQLRGVVAQALAAGAGPEEALEQLQRYAAQTPQVAGSNVVVADVDTRTGRARLCHRGHLPPLVVDLGGRPRSVAVGPSPPLGVRGEAVSVDDRLGDGETLVLFSNALVDRGTGSITPRLRRLRRDVAHDVHESLSETVSQVLSHRVRDERGRSDDATVVAARYRAQPRAPFRQSAIRSTGDQRAARVALRAWLQEFDVGEGTLFGIEQAVAAALAHLGNVAHVGAACEVQVEATLGQDGILTVTLRHRCSAASRDAGSASGATRGLGLIPMLHLVDDMDVRHADDGMGTIVRLRQSVSAPTLFQPSEELAVDTSPAPPLEAFLRREGERRVLLVSGPLRPNTLEDLRLALAATAVGEAPVVLDLSDVTELGGAGLALLHRIVGVGAVELRAATGSPASSVMRSSALPFEVSGAFAT